MSARVALPRRTLIALASACGVVAIVLAIDDGLPLQSQLFLLVGWSFVASGWVAWTRRPENHVGALMVGIGLLWFVSQLLRRWMEPLPLTLGIWLGDLWLLPLAFLLAGFPLARLHSRLDRVLIGALAVVMLPLELLWLLFLNFESFGGPDVPRNVLMIADKPAMAEAVDTVQRVILIVSLATLAAVLVRRWRRASAPLRRVLAPVLAGAAGLAMLARRLPAGQARDRPRVRVQRGLGGPVLGPDHLPRRDPARPPRPFLDRRPAGRPQGAVGARGAARRARPRAARPEPRTRVLGPRIRDLRRRRRRAGDCSRTSTAAASPRSSSATTPGSRR